jgi:RNA polymerase sigma-70 factor (ECF subfamily)
MVLENRIHADDIGLRDRIVCGDASAAESLLAAHLDPLYEFVHYRIGGDVERAQDVVHDTFLVALERMHAFDGRSSLYTWLCGIAKNKIRAARRARPARSLDEVLENADPEIDAILAQIEREPLPLQVIERQETRDLVGATLSSLPPEYKRALVEKYIEGRSVAEMAERRGRGEKATESMLTRARVAFVKVFELLAKKRGGDS